MTPELRETLGKAVYEATRQDYAHQKDLHKKFQMDRLLDWEYLDPEMQELNRKRGEAAAEVFAALSPGFCNVSSRSEEAMSKQQIRHVLRRLMAHYEHMTEREQEKMRTCDDASLAFDAALRAYPWNMAWHTVLAIAADLKISLDIEPEQ